MIQILHDTQHPLHEVPPVRLLFSLAVMLATVAWLVVHGGPRWSVDFTGGTLLQVQTAKVAARRRRAAARSTRPATAAPRSRRRATAPSS